jgi:hypothetical protein
MERDGETRHATRTGETPAEYTVVVVSPEHPQNSALPLFLRLHRL